MKKTNQTFFHSEKTIDLGRKLKFLALSMVFTMIFLGVSTISYSQEASSMNIADSEVGQIFKGVEFTQDKDAAIAVLMEEINSLQGQNPTSAAEEATIESTIFYATNVVKRISYDNVDVFTALTMSYPALVIEVDKVKNFLNVDTEEIALGIGQLLE